MRNDRLPLANRAAEALAALLYGDEASAESNLGLLTLSELTFLQIAGRRLAEMAEAVRDGAPTPPSRDELLAAALAQHEQVCSCDPRYVMSCNKMPRIILAAARQGQTVSRATPKPEHYEHTARRETRCELGSECGYPTCWTDGRCEHWDGDGLPTAWRDTSA